MCCTMQTVHSTLEYTLYCRVQTFNLPAIYCQLNSGITVHCTVNTHICTTDTSSCTVHTVSCKVYAALCIIHTVHCTKQLVSCTVCHLTVCWSFITQNNDLPLLAWLLWSCVLRITLCRCLLALVSVLTNKLIFQEKYVKETKTCQFWNGEEHIAEQTNYPILGQTSYINFTLTSWCKK